MSSRLLSAGLAAAMVLGLSAGAWAQAAGQSARRQPPAQEVDPSGAEADGNSGASPGATADPAGKDPFDEAAKGKGGAGKAGVSPGETTPRLEKATFGGGCFWHVEAEFEWLPGVRSAVSGYAGGKVPNPSYEMVHEGDTGHIEVVQVEYDPSIITYEQLLKVFWHGHDPTQWNYQGPDVGTQYRSAIFYHNEAQRKAALKSYRELTEARVYPAPIVTLLLPMKAFYRAEEYHQNYYGGKPDRPVSARTTRAKRAARSVARKKATGAAKAGSKKGADVRKADGDEGNDPAPAPGRSAPEPPDAKP